MALSVIDVPHLDLDPISVRASVRMEKPVSLVVQDDVEYVQVSLAMWASLDLERPAFYLVSSLGVAEQSDIADNLTDLCKLDSSLDGKLGVRIVNVAALYEDSTV